MDLNKVVLTGTIAEPKLGYMESGKPELRLSVTVDQGDGFRLYVQVYCYGKHAEPLAETLEAGDRVVIDGKLSWRSSVKAGVKESKMVVTFFGVDRLIETRDVSSEGQASGAGAIVDPEPAQVPSIFDAPQARKPRYPKWKPANAN